ncbi:replication initiation protein [Persicobacter sp. CCB-QB2]|uniref:replication initiation protein n=1 Tax=Persicobacter sp. CCB-QB2 TaxID=1561025 RepID=UPI0012FCF701
MNLQQGMALTGKYTKRIFDYISSIRNFKDHYGKYPYIDLLEFKNLMHLSEEDYSKFGIFRVRILDKAIKEINKYSDFNVRYTPVKKGRKIIGLTWQISKNPKSKVIFWNTKECNTSGLRL